MYQKIIPFAKNLLGGILTRFFGRSLVAKSHCCPVVCGGFTLIELLVVVLIMGILAALAIPKYQIAVEKSRAAEALTVMAAIVQAEEVYYMENASYTADFSELSISNPVQSTYWVYGWAGQSVQASPKKGRDKERYFLVYRVSRLVASGSARIACGTEDTASLEYTERLCKALGAKEKENERRWILSK